MNTLNVHARGRLRKLFGRRFSDDPVSRILYATDASAYREMPMGVVFPQSEREIAALVKLAGEEGFSLIPRTAGTSLAGQVVGNGLVVDVSRHMTGILELNTEEKWVRVQPGVVRDDLNRYLQPFGLFFGPETSTANRAMIGGMAGNNSCGSNSVVYGSVREHLLETRAVLSDGSTAVFGAEPEPGAAALPGTLLHRIYSQTLSRLSDPETAEEIRGHFPKETISRRNTGYAVDMLLRQEPFTPGGPPFSFNALLAGSEGTLAFFTELRLGLVPAPLPFRGLLAIHCQSVDEALRANLTALGFEISASELMDHYVFECTKNNREQAPNRFFVQGDPQAVLVVEITRATREEMEETAAQLTARLREAGLGYHFPLITGEDVARVWALRKAGLGLLSNMPGDAKPVAVIEDTAVDVRDLPAYIREFNEILGRRGMYAVHYAHAGSGELHLRPIIDLKTRQGHEEFRRIATDIAHLVKKYRGSLSGEHGDGRLRGEFIPLMVGEKNYRLFQEIKALWDPKGIFNPGKIVDSPPMDSHLRYAATGPDRIQETYFDFGAMSMQQHAEQCNGSGDCRKTPGSGGTMCPSFMATRDEKDSTRARANLLREIMTQDSRAPLARQEIKEVMDLCLSCKGCKSECPSNVDAGKLKAEYLQHYYNHHGIPFRSWLTGNFARFSALGSYAPALFNVGSGKNTTGRLFRKMLGFAPERSLPRLAPENLRRWFAREGRHTQPKKPVSSVWFFADEFTLYNDVEAGKAAIRLLQELGYRVDLPGHPESGRAFLSKGMLKEARKLALRQLEALEKKVHAGKPLLGLEPSAILTFADEYPDLLRGAEQERARELARHCLLTDEFLAAEFEAGRIGRSRFTDEEKTIRLHGHCHQKAMGRLAASKKILGIPKNYRVLLIPSGCCGMAGSFGYEAEHYHLSMQIGELVLFPAIRNMAEDVLLAAPGTSCRHQIADGTGRLARHPVEILWQALRKP